MSLETFKLFFSNVFGTDDEVKAFLAVDNGGGANQKLLTSTTAGGKEALDVNIAASDIQIQVDLTHTEDSIRLGDGTTLTTVTTFDGGDGDKSGLDVYLINEKIGGNLAVADSVLFNSVSQPTVTTTAVAVTAVAEQKKVEIQNLSTQDIEMVAGSGDNFGDGLLIPKKSVKEVAVAGDFWLVAAAPVATGDVRVGHFTAT